MLRQLMALVGVFGSLLAAAPPCSAARIYQIVDYPEFQQGYSLRGTITTTDNAHQDGTLDGEEILNWHWAVDGPQAFAFSSGAGSSLDFQGIGITDDAILLPQTAIASAYLRGTSG